jgi:hypothetical protein
MHLLPQFLKIEIKRLSDLENSLSTASSLFKTHLHLNLSETLAEIIPLEFSGTVQELKWKVLELVKVPIEEILYAYAPDSKKLYLLDKKLWQEKMASFNSQTLEIEKVTLEDLPLQGLEMNEPLLHYSQIKKGIKSLGFLAIGLAACLCVLSIFFKAPSYQTLAALNETSQNLKSTLNQVIETEKELSIQKEKIAQQKKWIKIFKTFPQQLPGLIKLSEMSLDETGQVMQLNGETKNQTLLQAWAKQIPRLTLTQVQLLPSPNAGYHFAATIASESQD